MIRYRKLYESEDSGIKLYDTVRCGGYEWYITDIKGDIVTLLAKNPDFGKSIFNIRSHENDYKTSTIRNYLKTRVLSDLNYVKVNPISTRLNDVGCLDKAWLLSVREAEKLPENIRNFGEWWWLRTKGKTNDYVIDVDDDGIIADVGDSVNLNELFVRPAIRVHVEDLD